jgi:hypothetical protein
MFCSDECMLNSASFASQLSTFPVHMRQLPPTPPPLLGELSIKEKGGFTGNERSQESKMAGETAVYRHFSEKVDEVGGREKATQMDERNETAKVCIEMKLDMSDPTSSSSKLPPSEELGGMIGDICEENGFQKDEYFSFSSSQSPSLIDGYASRFLSSSRNGDELENEIGVKERNTKKTGKGKVKTGREREGQCQVNKKTPEIDEIDSSDKEEGDSFEEIEEEEGDCEKSRDLQFLHPSAQPLLQHRGSSVSFHNVISSTLLLLITKTSRSYLNSK